MMLKRFIDIFGACFFLLLCSPILAFVAILIKLDSNGPVFFKQVRMGQNFRPFNRYKFRTMVYDKRKSLDEVVMEGMHDFTRVGHLLRLLKLDELPQLLNVLKGEMSFVGPRPELPYYVDKFRDEYQKNSKRAAWVNGSYVPYLY